MTCDCLMWRAVDRLEEAADKLVSDGIVADADRDACFEALIRFASLNGFMGKHAVNTHIGVAAITNRERKAVVDRYLAFSRTAASDNERHAKIQALGVTRYQICRWAKRFRPGALRELNVPRHLVILDIVSHQPWLTLAEIVGATGLPRPTTIGGLYKLWQRGKLQRRKGRLKVYEYALPDADVPEPPQTSAVSNQGAPRPVRLSRRGCAA